MKVADYSKVFQFRHLNYVHAPKMGSRTILGWFALIQEPSLYQFHPEYFVGISKGDEAYTYIRNLRELTSEIDLHKKSFCVVRDPVERFISAFKNRVLTHDECEEKDFGRFVDNFDYYYETNRSVGIHFRPATDFYGTDRSIYDKVFRLEHLGSCKEWLEEEFDCKLPDIKLQQSVKVDIKPTEEQIEKIKHIFRKDYKHGWT